MTGKVFSDTAHAIAPCYVRTSMMARMEVRNPPMWAASRISEMIMVDFLLGMVFLIRCSFRYLRSRLYPAENQKPMSFQDGIARDICLISPGRRLIFPHL